nr:uncharacterized protein LOC109163389 [Ipomoea batatas]
MASKAVGLLVCALILALDIVAGILGIKAEAEQDKEKHLRLWLFECKEPSHEAFVLGAAAIGVLVIAHLIANLFGGCSVCATDEIKNASTRKQIAIAFLAFTCFILPELRRLYGDELSSSELKPSPASCGLKAGNSCWGISRIRALWDSPFPGVVFAGFINFSTSLQTLSSATKKSRTITKRRVPSSFPVFPWKSEVLPSVPLTSDSFKSVSNLNASAPPRWSKLRNVSGEQPKLELFIFCWCHFQKSLNKFRWQLVAWLLVELEADRFLVELEADNFLVELEADHFLVELEPDHFLVELEPEHLLAELEPEHILAVEQVLEQKVWAEAEEVSPRDCQEWMKSSIPSHSLEDFRCSEASV